MTAVTELRQHGRPFTVADLESTPDDGRRYEVLDGCLLVTPMAGVPHQVVVQRLAVLLDGATPGDLLVLPGIGVLMADDTELQPDVIVARRADLTRKCLPAPPLLAIEVLSRSTRGFDLHTKKARYEAFGTTAYWVVDPDTARLRAWELRDGVFAEVADVTGAEAFAATVPFPVTVVPADLVAY